jgi:hypothetical protein
LKTPNHPERHLAAAGLHIKDVHGRTDKVGIPAAVVEAIEMEQFWRDGPPIRSPGRSGFGPEPVPIPPPPETVVCNTCKTTVTVGQSCPVCSRGGPAPDVLVIEKSGA